MYVLSFQLFYLSFQWQVSYYLNNMLIWLNLQLFSDYIVAFSIKKIIKSNFTTCLWALIKTYFQENKANNFVWHFPYCIAEKQEKNYSFYM